MKKILIAGVLFFASYTTGFAATFSDVPENHPQYEAIETLKTLNIINGYNDGTFQPEKTVNRAEALKIILTGAKVQIAENVNAAEFSDVPTDAWFAKYVAVSKSLGIVKGNPDGTFAPGRLVNKAEFVKMLLQAFKKDLSQHQTGNNVSNDVSASDWFYSYMSYAKTVGVVSPTLTNELLPSKSLTRGETAEILYKMIVVEQGGDVQKLLSIAEANLVTALIAINEGNIEKAQSSSNSAIFYTQQALEKSPDTGIVKAANKIAKGFQKIALAFKNGTEGNFDELRKNVADAKTLSQEALKDDASMENLAKKIQALGDLLLIQVK